MVVVVVVGILVARSSKGGRFPYYGLRGSQLLSKRSPTLTASDTTHTPGRSSRCKSRQNSVQDVMAGPLSSRPETS